MFMLSPAGLQMTAARRKRERKQDLAKSVVAGRKIKSKNKDDFE